MMIIESADYWDTQEHRRKFLLSFAEKAGFDPLQSANWRKRQPQLRASGVIQPLLQLTHILITLIYRVHVCWNDMKPCRWCYLILFPSLKYKWMKCSKKKKKEVVFASSDLKRCGSCETRATSSHRSEVLVLFRVSGGYEVHLMRSQRPGPPGCHLLKYEGTEMWRVELHRVFCPWLWFSWKSS